MPLPKENEAARLPKIALCVAGSEVRRRIECELALSEVDPDVLGVEPSQLVDAELSPATIIVISCDLDVPEQLHSVREVARARADSPLLLVTGPVSGGGVRRALDAGAVAVVFEPEIERCLSPAIAAVASGLSVVPRSLAVSLERPVFSHRERQVLARVSRGLTNAQIADQLCLAESTVKSHLSTAFAKFGVGSRREAGGLYRELERFAMDRPPA